jgi:hypothetical protein
MNRLNVMSLLGLGALIASGVAQAQSVISAHAGLVHYTEGRVLIGDKVIEAKSSTFPEVKANEILRTEDGRAELLLTPGAFLRLAEDSSIRMVSNKLTDARVEALKGSMLLEFGDQNKDDSVALLLKGKNITFKKAGIYRLDVDQGLLKVYRGEAEVAAGGQTLTVKEAKEVDLNAAVLMASKFDNKTGDEFFRWASRRAGYIATANVSAARAMHDSGVSLSSGAWAFNPWFNMFTYVPYNSMWSSPFGYSFFGPGGIGWVYGYNPYYYGGYRYGRFSGGNGYVGGGHSEYSVPSRSASLNGARPGAIRPSSMSGFSRGDNGANFGGYNGGYSPAASPSFGGGRGGYSGGGGMSAPAAAPSGGGMAGGGGGGGASHGGGHR